MEKILERHDRPVPAEYMVTAVLAGIVVGTCYLTTRWVPWFVHDMTSFLPGAFSPLGFLVLQLGLLALVASMVSLVWLAFRWPALAIVLAMLPIVPALFDPNDGRTIGVVHFGVFATLAGIAFTAAWRRPRVAVAATLVAVATVWWWVTSGKDMAAPFGAHIQTEYGGGPIALGGVYTVALLAVLGGALLLRRVVLREEDRRRLASRAGQVEEQSAVVEERARLARDLHDVVAHHVSLIAVRAETAPYTHTDLGPSAKTVLSDIAADARLALDELRGVLGILGRAGEGAERTPQPTWDDITALVERTRAAGLDVTLEGDTVVNVPATVGYAAYRVVQEGLTNARKHAPGAPARVVLSATDRLVHVSVRNPAATQAASTGGRGLVGMRERVSALGGRMTAGAVAGEYVVEVTLPVVPS